MNEAGFAPNIMIVESRFVPDVADELARGAIAQLTREGATYKRCPVPTLFEVPVAIRYAIRAIELFPARKRFDGYIALGCAIRSEDSPHDLLSSECTHALMGLTVQFSLATGFGVVAVDTREEAWTRASVKGDDYGGQAAKTCLEMIRLKTDFKLFPRSQ